MVFSNLASLSLKYPSPETAYKKLTFSNQLPLVVANYSLVLAICRAANYLVLKSMEMNTAKDLKQQSNIKNLGLFFLVGYQQNLGIDRNHGDLKKQSGALWHPPQFISLTT